MTRRVFLLMALLVSLSSFNLSVYADDKSPLEEWVEKVNANPGWNAPPERQATAGNIRIKGVWWTPNRVIIATTARAHTVNGSPAITSAYLEFNHRQMQRWTPPIEAAADTVFWEYNGQAPDRFQISVRLSDGSQHWGCITSMLGRQSGVLAHDGTANSIYNPADNPAGIDDHDVLSSGVIIDNREGRESLRVVRPANNR